MVAAADGAAATVSALPAQPARGRVVRIKVISMGDMGAGKSCLIKRYCEDKFISRYIPTIGIDYGVKPVHFAVAATGGANKPAAGNNSHEVRVNLWDLAGSPDYLEVRNEFYRDSQAALLVFDATSRASFESLGSWLAEAAKYGAPAHMVVFVVATKADLPGRKVTQAEGRDWAAARGYPYAEASAATGAGVSALFACMFSDVLAQLPNLQDGALRECAAQEAAAACAAARLERLQLNIKASC